MLIGISIPWYEMLCSYETAIDIIPKNVWAICNLNNTEVIALDEMPIKCKDCIYWKSDKERAKQTAWLPCMEMKTDRNWFCESAKKKEVQRNSK